MNCDRGTNTRGELLALWCILFFASYKKVKRFTIDWFTNDNNLHVIYLQPWMTKNKMLSWSFQQLKAQHIYRVYNKEVDQPSKEALLLDEDGIYFSMDIEG